MEVVTSLLLIVGIWCVFVIGVGEMLFIQPCRKNACWQDGGKFKRYIEITNPRLAAILIPQYIGFNDHFGTNISRLYNKYYVNKYPNRISIWAIICDFICGALYALFVIGFTAGFFLQQKWAENLLLISVFGGMGYNALMFVVAFGNAIDGKVKEMEIITKAEMKRRKAQAKGDKS